MYYQSANQENTKITKVALCPHYRVTKVACQAQKDNFGCFLRIHQNVRGVFVFYDRFVQLCNQRGVSRTKACIDCGVSRTAWHKWEDGGMPNGATLNKFSAYFGVSVDYLSGNKEKTPTVSGERKVTDEDIKFALFGGDGEITDEMYAEVKQFAAFVKNRGKEK